MNSSDDDVSYDHEDQEMEVSSSNDNYYSNSEYTLDSEAEQNESTEILEEDEEVDDSYDENNLTENYLELPATDDEVELSSDDEIEESEEYNSEDYSDEYHDFSNVSEDIDNSVIILDYSTFPNPILESNYVQDTSVISINEESYEQSLNSSEEKSVSRQLTCAVCLDTLKEKNKPVSTNCGHLFCYNCLTIAIKKTKKCPLCNSKQGSKTFHRIYF